MATTRAAAQAASDASFQRWADGKPPRRTRAVLEATARDRLDVLFFDVDTATGAGTNSGHYTRLTRELRRLAGRVANTDVDGVEAYDLLGRFERQALGIVRELIVEFAADVMQLEQIEQSEAPTA